VPVKHLLQLAAKARRRIIGLMSGTSADGVDAVLVDVEGSGRATQCHVLAFVTVPLPAGVRQRVLALCASEARVEDLCLANFALGEVFAEAALAVVRHAGLPISSVDLIGSHGQTVRHLPQGDPAATLQIGESAVIAARTGVVTIADFRPADMAWGGQGAPLVPKVDWLLFSHPEVDRAILNLGGIANLTVLPRGGAADGVVAFDTGPGNMLIDGAVAQLTSGHERCDQDGARAARGRVDTQLLAWLMAHPFLARRPPKSTGREEFGEPYLALARQRFNGVADDLIATLTAFTARSVAEALLGVVGPKITQLWVAGGGVHNPALMAQLRGYLPGVAVASLAALGVDPDAREALTFALLANETLMDEPGNLPSATGATRPVVLGKITVP
jgi:anhydro-N-acetylmuramic acid kinase